MARGIFTALTSPSAADMNELSQVPRCRLFNSAAISIPNVTLTALTFNTEVFDAAAPNNMHDTATNTSRITVPTGGAGWYAITGTVEFAANVTGYRELRVRLNGVTNIAIQRTMPVTSAGVTHIMNIAVQYPLNVGDYVELAVAQTSGGALNVTTASDYSPSFQACWMAVL